jgi:hypothetical protein
MPERAAAETVDAAAWTGPPPSTDALYDLRAAPALPLVCGRCGRVLEWVAVDVAGGRVFFRDRDRERVGRRGRGRWPSVRLRDYVDGDGHACAQLTYRCDHECRMTYRIDFDAMQDACLGAARAGHALVALDIE